MAQELVANFTLEQNKKVDAVFDISTVQFDALFQINVTPDISDLATKEELQEVSNTINNRIDNVIDTFNGEVEDINLELAKTVQNIQGVGTVDATREGQNVTIATKTYIFEQGIASDVWVIEHNLNKYPAIELVDSAGRQFKSQIEYNSLNSCTVYLNGATTGKAYLN